MPELPEVETTRRGIAPHLLRQQISGVIIREPRLRWPIDAALPAQVTGQTIHAVTRRGKYLLLGLDRGHLILHLGMSGSLRVLPRDIPPTRHDHVDFIIANGQQLRLRDPRRFGSLHWTREPSEQHPLLSALGPEPLSDLFTGRYLYTLSRTRQVAVKNFIMNAQVVVGIGNIYANEALYHAGIHPRRAAGRISADRYQRLAQAIKTVLLEAIAKGGTTLRDFTDAGGQAGYFRIELAVYERAGEPCQCGETIRHINLGQRSTYYCPRCQR